MPTGDGLVKGSVAIAGHRTSISLEPIFWAALRTVAVEQGRPLNALITEIDAVRTTNLSSAIRVWLFERAQQMAAAATAMETVEAVSPSWAELPRPQRREGVG